MESYTEIKKARKKDGASTINYFPLLFYSHVTHSNTNRGSEFHQILDKKASTFIIKFETFSVINCA